MIRHAWSFGVLAIGIVVFAVPFFLWAVACWVLWPVLPARMGRVVGRRGAMAGFRFCVTVMEWLGAWRLDMGEVAALRNAGPLIVAPNHPGLLDAVMMVSRMPDAVCVMKGSLLANFLLAPAARLASYLLNDSLLKLVTRAHHELQGGAQLLLFPEGTRTRGGPIGPLTEAVGAISRRTQVPVQTVIIEMSAPFLSKGSSLAAPPPFPIHFRLRLGRRFDPPQDVRAFTEELDRYFRRELATRSSAAPEASPARSVEDASQLRG